VDEVDGMLVPPAESRYQKKHARANQHSYYRLGPPWGRPTIICAHRTSWQFFQHCVAALNGDRQVFVTAERTLVCRDSSRGVMLWAMRPDGLAVQWASRIKDLEVVVVLLEPGPLLKSPQPDRIGKPKERAPAIQNLLGVSLSGAIVWRASMPEPMWHPELVDYYVKARVQESVVMGWTASGFLCQVDPSDGSLLQVQFGK